ncbi:MAG: hypothetical protein ING60_10690 [Rhodocyclaceae bacterium]|nr:hypothetical protein [Rhodocyclaceae bacterium]
MSTIERVAREPVIRGCGSRKAGGVYLCTGLAEHGLPIESFFIDPVKAMAVECFRAPTLIDDPFVEGLKHIAVWIGAEHYLSPADYLEECRRLGASRRIPSDFDFTPLTPGKSRMVMIHPLAFTERIDEATCPVGVEGHGHAESDVACLGQHWRYVEALGSKLIPRDDKPIELAAETRLARIGQISYEVPVNQLPVQKCEFSPGAFLQLPITHIEYQARDRDDLPDASVQERLAQTNFDMLVVDEVGGSGASESESEED